MNSSVKSMIHESVESQAPVRIPLGGDLEQWARHDWQNGLQVDDLWAGDELIVRTANTTYTVWVISPRNREVIILGGLFFPERTRVRVDGCSLRGAFLKLGGLYIGFSVELRNQTGVVITSPVQSISFVQHG